LNPTEEEAEEDYAEGLGFTAFTVDLLSIYGHAQPKKRPRRITPRDWVLLHLLSIYGTKVIGLHIHTALKALNSSS